MLKIGKWNWMPNCQFGCTLNKCKIQYITNLQKYMISFEIKILNFIKMEFQFIFVQPNVEQ